MSEDTAGHRRPNAVFRGVVQDDHGHWIEGMLRVYQGDSARINRKVEGSFQLHLEPGRYRIEVSAEGYLSQQHSLALAPGSGTAHQFVMRKRPEAHLVDRSGPENPEGSST